jgi:TRAP-type mannitol/chloroaromatic compound transport system substrate-binding protein
MSVAQVAEKAGIPVVTASSIKAALDIDWSDPAARTTALRTLLGQVSKLREWLAEELAEVCQEPPLKQQLEIYDTVTDKKSADNPMFKKILESQIAFARRATQWEQDTVVGRRMAFDHYFGANGKLKKT